MRMSTLLAKLENATVNLSSRTVHAVKAYRTEVQIERDAKAIARATELLGNGVAEITATRAQEIVAARQLAEAEVREAKIAKLKAELEQLTKA